MLSLVLMVTRFIEFLSFVLVLLHITVFHLIQDDLLQNFAPWVKSFSKRLLKKKVSKSNANSRKSTFGIRYILLTQLSRASSVALRTDSTLPL